ncbi:MAG: hypothetical protein AB7I27_16990 [Bacteriovoracaceae bacterium]
MSKFKLMMATIFVGLLIIQSHSHLDLNSAFRIISTEFELLDSFSEYLPNEINFNFLKTHDYYATKYWQINLTYETQAQAPKGIQYLLITHISLPPPNYST